jgi:hypothetical protein
MIGTVVVHLGSKLKKENIDPAISLSRKADGYPREAPTAVGLTNIFHNRESEFN